MIVFGEAHRSGRGKFGADHQQERNQQITGRDQRGLADTDSRAVHQTKEGHDGSGQSEAGGFHHLAVNDAYGGGAENQSAQSGAVTQNLQATIIDSLVQHSGGELVRNGGDAGGREGIVDHV